MMETDATPVSDKRSSLTRNAAARFVGEGATLVCVQASAILIARALGPDGKGLASLLALISTIALLTTDCGLTMSGVYYVGARKYPTQAVVSTFLATGVAVSAAAATALLVLSRPLAGAIFHGRYQELIMLLAAGIPAGLLYNWLSGVLRGQEKLVAVSVVSTGAAAAGLLVLVLGLYVFALKESAIVWWTNTTAFVGLLASVYLITRQGIRLMPRFDARILRSSINYGLRAQAGLVLQFINYRFDFFVVNYFMGIASVGVYGIGTGVAQMIWQIPNALSFALYSRVSSIEHNEGNAVTQKTVRTSFFLSFVAALLLAPLGYLLIPAVFGEPFRPAVKAMWLLLPGVVALSHYKTLGVHLAGQGHPEYYSYGAAISAALTLVLDFLLIPRYGINGAAVASSVAYITGSAICVQWFVSTSGMTKVSRLFIPERDDLRSLMRLIHRNSTNVTRS